MQQRLLVTSDDHKIPLSQRHIDLLTMLKDFFEEFSQDTGCLMEITKNDWELIQRYLDYLELPENRYDLVSLIDKLDYFGLEALFTKVLKDLVIEMNPEISLVKPIEKLTLQDLSWKLSSPVPLSDEQCQWVFTQGRNVGARCMNFVTEYGKEYCGICSHKKKPIG